MSRRWQYIFAMLAGLLVLLSGVVVLSTAGEIAPLGALLIAVGLLSLIANVFIRTRTN